MGVVLRPSDVLLLFHSFLGRVGILQDSQARVDLDFGRRLSRVREVRDLKMERRNDTTMILDPRG